jgi:hypothetical protein
MSSTSTPRNISDVPELFIVGQYLKDAGIHAEFALAAVAETGRFVSDPWDTATDLSAFHAFMMSYLNL